MSDDIYRKYGEECRESKTYVMHIDRMTREDLRSKSDIAAELTYRDNTIKDLRESISGIGGYLGRHNADQSEIKRLGRSYAEAQEEVTALHQVNMEQAAEIDLAKSALRRVYIQLIENGAVDKSLRNEIAKLLGGATEE